MADRILICTDLDRTLLPNGSAPESPEARLLFSALVARSEVVLAYVSGRHKELIEQAMAEYRIPQPDFVIADVGTSLYRLDENGWHVSDAWTGEIAPDWAGYDHTRLQRMFKDLTALALQEQAKQNRFKLSYYLATHIDTDQLLTEMRRRLNDCGIKAELIYSTDETNQVGLLDVLPASATKYHAVEFLMKLHDLGIDDTVFAGDSGNDLPVLASPIHAVLVGNAGSDVREQAKRLAMLQGTQDALYLAQGNFLGMNGNYSAGILEGVAHYLPRTQQWMKLDDR